MDELNIQKKYTADIIVIGITGYIGSGKSTAISIIKNLLEENKISYKTFVLDDFAKKIQIKNNIVFELDEDNFLTKNAEEKIKKDFHKLVWNELRNKLYYIIEEKTCRKSNTKEFIIIETALPNEDFFEIVDYSICIENNKNKFLLKNNRNYSDKKIEKIINAQKFYEKYYNSCNIVINNDTLEELKSKLKNCILNLI